MKTKYLPLFGIWLLLCSCGPVSSFHPGGREYEELREARSTEGAREQFNSYPVQTQIDVYLFGLKYIEPDDSSSKTFLVDDGEKKIPTIIQRIRDTDEEFDKAYLIEVVSMINKDCKCVTEEQKEILFQIGSSLKGYHRGRFKQAFEELNK